MDFENLNYLKTGSPQQQKVFDVLESTKIMAVLQEFTPVLAGTFPIDIATDNSDLDIICFWKDKSDFIETLENHFGSIENFSIRELSISNQETVVANFILENFDFEVFGQNVPVKRQFAFRHMVTEYEILKQKGEIFRQQIIELKKNGFKTEPAFAKLLQLPGDPYAALLEYKSSE